MTTTAALVAIATALVAFALVNVAGIRILSGILRELRDEEGRSSHGDAG